MCHLDELKPELQPPARLQTIQKRVGQQWHSAISGICHNDEIVGEEELRRVVQAVDDQVNGGIILKNFASTKRSERPLPSKIQPELEAAPAWALLTRQHDAVDVEICTGRLGYGVAWNFDITFQLPCDRRGKGVGCAGDGEACKAQEDAEGAQETAD